MQWRGPLKIRLISYKLRPKAGQPDQAIKLAIYLTLTCAMVN